VLKEVQSGRFARQWIRENVSGRPNYQKLLNADMEHPIEKVGASLRARMPWLQEKRPRVVASKPGAAPGKRAAAAGKRATPTGKRAPKRAAGRVARRARQESAAAARHAQ
jgi:hypothetical protein